MNRGPLGLSPVVTLLAGIHLLVDGYGNVLTPLLPLLIPQLGLSLAAAGLLQTCYQMAGSVAQLGFGHLADRWKPRVLLTIGPLVGVSVLMLVGLAQSATALAVILVIGGLGGAAFHPPAAALVHRHSAGNHGFAMSFHITSGTLGQALAPLAFAPFVQQFGLAATPWLMLPAVVLLVVVLLPRVPALDPVGGADEGGGLEALRPYARPLTLLYGIVVLRTLTALSFSTFVPVMLTRRGLSIAEAGAIASIFLVAVGTGGFFGGSLADRFGARRVIVWSLVLSVPFLAVAPALHGWWFVLTLAVGGFLLQSTLPVNVTFAQLLAPISAATVSSLMMGFAWGTGGLAVPLVGLIADHVGIDATLTAMALLPLVAAALALPLPEAAARGNGGSHGNTNGSEPSEVAARRDHGRD